MNQFLDKRVAKLSFLFLNIVFFVIHSILLIFFVYFKISLMAYVNIASVCLYALGYLLIYKEKLALYVNMMAAEVIVHMVIATIAMGPRYGFQLCLLGVICVFFYADYFAMKMDFGPIHAMRLSLISMGGYVLATVCSWVEAPLYVINEWVEHVICMIITVMIFIIYVAAMRSLTLFAVNSENRLVKKAECDALTGLPNRYSMIEIIQEVIEQDNAQDYWLAMIDIDNFKGINDTYGHNCGDDVLVMLARTLTKNQEIRPCRWGGEEFLILGKKDRDGQIPLSLLEDIRHSVKAVDMKADETFFHITITMGAAAYEQGCSLEEWVEIADKKLYVGKYTGKNRVVV